MAIDLIYLLSTLVFQIGAWWTNTATPNEKLEFQVSSMKSSKFCYKSSFDSENELFKAPKQRYAHTKPILIGMKKG